MKHRVTDGARLYHEEVRERTQLARHALRRRQHKAMVLNDYTDAELQALNGPVRTYSMKEGESVSCRA